ncbi:MAG: hypothetical protein WBL68_07785 [Nitrososphaeraceae archaeon]
MLSIEKEDRDRIRNKHDLLYALTDRDTFVRISQLDGDLLNSTEYRDITAGRDNNYMPLNSL